jgi:prepilin-type N-terminal cleavage/methylation domain-containing protein
MTRAPGPQLGTTEFRMQSVPRKPILSDLELSHFERGVFMFSRAVRYRRTGSKHRSPAFTLIELMVVIAIITLLISILLPTLSKARVQGQNVKTRAALKSIGEGAELYRNENESDQNARLTNGYPPSALGEDAAVAGNQEIGGAQWIVRYLMGKDLAGYAPRRNVPAALLNPGDPAEEVTWYEYNTDGTPKVDRLGRYIEGEAAKIVPTRDLPAAPGTMSSHPWANMEEQVFTDVFGNPILYYLANPAQANKTRPNLASYNGSVPGVYTMADNGYFTGACAQGVCTKPPWDFGSGTSHPLGEFGFQKDQPIDPNTVLSNAKCFPFYILNRPMYDASTNGTAGQPRVAVPWRKESFLLISAGKDGIFGTPDDIANFR